MYKLNSEAVILLDSDTSNGFSTVAYDWMTDDVVAIRKSEYLLLEFINKLGEVSIDDLTTFAEENGVDESVLKNIVNRLILHNIITEK